MTPSLNEPQLDEVQLKEHFNKQNTNYWREEYADFVKTYNEAVAQEGLPLSEWTTF